MSPLERLGRRAVLDGAVGTQLMARGLRVGQDCPEAWNVERAEEVRGVYASYFAAGADAVQTNTFGGTRLRLSVFGRQTQVRQLNLAGVLLAREVRPEGKLVIGSLGPTGATPPPEGRTDLIELEDAYAEQAMALREAGVDALHIETMYHPKEARAAIRGAREGAPDLPLVASMTCKLQAGGRYATPAGFPAELLLSVFLEEKVDAVGANCTLAPVDLLDLVRLMRSRTDKPIFVKPTVAPPASPPVVPEELGVGALALYAAGATAVGGCCGAGPEDVAAIRRAVDSAPGELSEIDAV